MTPEQAICRDNAFSAATDPEHSFDRQLGACQSIDGNADRADRIATGALLRVPRFAQELHSEDVGSTALGDQQSGGNSIDGDPYADHPVLSTISASARIHITESIAQRKTILAIKLIREAIPELGLVEAREIILELPTPANYAKAGAGSQSRSRQLISGIIDKGGTTLTIYRDGTFTTKGLFFTSEPDRLLGFSSDSDSMRRKSTTGRGAAFIATGGISILASNNRGVLYVTVTGQRSGAKTYTSKNPENRLLTTVRSLQAAADQLLTSPPTSAAPSRQPSATETPHGSDIGTQLKTLSDLHASGALSDLEFAAAKARLLS